MAEYVFGNPEVIEEEVDMLIIGGGMAACGTAFEVPRWIEGTGLKVKLVDKAALSRSGAVAQGLSAINTYLGENDPADYVRYVRNDLMGIVREDLIYDVGRHVDDSVHNFEDWGLPIWKAQGDEEKSLRNGRQAGALGPLADHDQRRILQMDRGRGGEEGPRHGQIQERVFIVRLINDKNDPTRIAGAAGFSVREHKLYIYKFKACMLAAGGAVNVFRPRSVGEGGGRAWFPVWNAGSTYSMAAEAGAEMTMMENRFVPARFKDGYGPVGAWFLLFKAKVMNGMGEDYNALRGDSIKDEKRFGKYGQGVPGTCLRNHIMLEEMINGRGPIFMDTPAALAKLGEKMTPKELKHLEAEAWEDFLDMTISQCGIWAGENIEPEKTMSEIMPTEPYLLGSHSGCAGLWVSGPIRSRPLPGVPKEWSWGYRSMTTVKGLFSAGDGVGASGHKFSSGSHAEGRIAGKAMVKYCLDNKDWKPELDRSTQDTGRRDLQAGAHLPRAQGLHHGDRHQSALHHAQDAAVPAAEDHGRVRRRRGHLLPHQQEAARDRGVQARYAEGRLAQDARQGPARAAARLGELPPHHVRRGAHETHPVPRGDPLSGLLLPYGLQLHR